MRWLMPAMPATAAIKSAAVSTVSASVETAAAGGIVVIVVPVMAVVVVVVMAGVFAG